MIQVIAPSAFLTQSPPLWALWPIPVPMIPVGVSVQAEGCCFQFIGSNTSEAEHVSQRLTDTLRGLCRSHSSGYTDGHRQGAAFNKTYIENSVLIMCKNLELTAVSKHRPQTDMYGLAPFYTWPAPFVPLSVSLPPIVPFCFPFPGTSLHRSVQRYWFQ